ncbi:MAG TPA: PQQ-binding-like beta-propeller repeat protein [Egicoccus sp.]|nr:PQQ-binding-like beta-propeller repeat protein [Egicoccus sp.]
MSAVALLVDGFDLPRGRPDPTVELADENGEDVVAQGEPLSADERAALLAPFDPNRLRCEPEGCEVWRIDFGRSATDREVGIFGDLVISTVGETITAFDVATGEEVWQRDWPATDAQRSRGWTVMLSADDDLLVMVRPESGHLLGLRGDGTVAWQEHEPRPMQNFQLAGGVLLTSQLERPGRRTAGDGEVTFPSERIVAHDAATGAHLWERTNTSLMSSSAAVTVAREGGDGIALDPVDGSVRARRELATDVWLYALGQVVLLFTQEGTTGVLTTDLEPIPELAGLTDLQPISRNGQPLTGYSNGRVDFLVGIRRDEDDGSVRIVTADAAGRVLWEVEPPPTAGTPTTCCRDPRLTADALALTMARDSDGPQEVWFDLDDGTVVEPRDDVPPPPAVNNAWWLTPSVAIEQRTDGVRLHDDGAVLDVLGEGAWPLTHRPLYVFTNGRSLLGVQPVPAG